MVQVLVKDNDINKALRILKKKIQKEGLQLEIKNRRYYETGTAKKKREKNEAIKREKKRLSREKDIW